MNVFLGIIIIVIIGLLEQFARTDIINIYIITYILYRITFFSGVIAKAIFNLEV